MINTKSASVFGASGLVGSQLVELLIKDPNYNRIVVGNRHPIDYGSSKVTEVVIDFNSLEEYDSLFDVDELFICLGTTIKKAGSKSKFEYVDLQLPLSIAAEAKKAQVKCLTMISALDANSKSTNFYLKTKGRAENAIMKLDFPNCFFVRPSLLLGKRSEKRIAEGIAQWWMKKLNFLFIGPLKKYKAIKAIDVARSMLFICNSKQDGVIFSSEKLQEFSNQYLAQK